MEEERNGALWDGNEKTIFKQPHHQQCVQLRVSTSVTLDQIHICLLSQANVWCHRVCNCWLHIAAKPHSCTGRRYISENKSVRSAASPQVFLAAHVCSCLSPPAPPHFSASSSVAYSNGKQILRDVIQSLIALSKVSTQRHQSCSCNSGKESKDLKLGLKTAACYHP